MVIGQQVAEENQQAEEAAWVRRTLAGDKDAFAALCERYQRAVYTHTYYRLLSVEDAEDATQEIFQRAYLKLATFDTSRRFRSWILAIATNYCIDIGRQRGSMKRFIQQWVSLDVADMWVSGSDANPEGSVLQHEEQKRVRQAVSKLPETYREVVVLFYWNNLSYTEIAEVTGLSESTIKTRLHRAREKLIGLLEGG